MELIHSPEKWGDVAGMQRFQLNNVKGPISLGKESLICFDINGRAVRLIGRRWDQALIALWDEDSDKAHTSVRVNVNEYAPNVFSLVIDLKSDRELDIDNLKNRLRDGVQRSLLEEDGESVQDPNFWAYRQHLQVPDFFQRHVSPA